MLLRFQVEPQEAPRLKTGMPRGVHDARDAARVHREDQLVAGAADLTTHMVGVTAQVDATDDHTYWLRPGSFCDVTLDVGAQRDARGRSRAPRRARPTTATSSTSPTATSRRKCRSRSA